MDPAAPSPFADARRDFADLSRRLRAHLAERYARPDHRLATARVWAQALGCYGAGAATVLGGLSAGLPHAPLYALGASLAYLGHRFGSAAMHARGHDRPSTPWPLVDRSIDLLGAPLTQWSSVAFDARHRVGHDHHIGLYAEALAPQPAAPTKETIGYYVNPILGVATVADAALCARGGMDRRLLALQVGLICLMAGAAAAEILVAGTAFLLVCHLLSGLVHYSAVSLLGSMVHSSMDPENSLESCAILNADGAAPQLAVSLRILDGALARGIGTGHTLHHAVPEAATLLLERELAPWRAHILARYPSARHNTVLAHQVFPRTLAALPAPTPWDGAAQAAATLLAVGLLSLKFLGLAPESVYVVSELLCVDWRLLARLLRRDATAAAELGAWLDAHDLGGDGAPASPVARRLRAIQGWLAGPAPASAA